MGSERALLEAAFESEAGRASRLGRQPRRADAGHPQGLLQRLLEGPADGHDLADRLHLAADAGVDVLELAEVPARNLDDAVVEGGLEAALGGARYAILDLRHRLAEGELGGDEGEGVAGGLGGQGRAAREPGVDLDDAVLLRMRVEGVLDVALADDAEVPDDLDGDASAACGTRRRSGSARGRRRCSRRCGCPGGRGSPCCRP